MIRVLNEWFGAEWGERDRLFLESIKAEAKAAPGQPYGHCFRDAPNVQSLAMALGL